jgi:hypothetical protein
MNVPAVRMQYTTILHRIRWVLAVQQYAHSARAGAQIDAVARFDEWWAAHITTIETKTRTWAIDLLDHATSRWGPRIDMMANVDALIALANSLAVLPGYYPMATYQVTVRPPPLP